MVSDRFPDEYAKSLRARAESDVKLEEKRSKDKRKQILEEGVSQVNEFIYGGIGGGICGIGGMVFNYVRSIQENDGIGSSVLLTIVLFGVFLGMIVGSIRNTGRVNKWKIEAKLKAEEETARCKETVAKLQAQAKSNEAAYRLEFEQEVKRQSIEYAESALATEVIQWMTTGLAKSIDAADRRSYINKIVVPFDFYVYTDKITCNLGTYDFQLHRCANLPNALEQAALAQAIASAIQLNITMKYPKDASGTDFVLDISCSYVHDENTGRDVVGAKICYTAPNGNYVPVQNWKGAEKSTE